MGLKEDIIEAFLDTHELSFSEIQHKTGIRSNHLSYHLNKLVDTQQLAKTENGYRLSASKQRDIPYLNDIRSPLPVVLVGVWQDGKVLLHRRQKRPYKDKWSLLGARIHVDEHIEEAAKRVAYRIAGVDIDNVQLQTVAHEHTLQDEEIKHAFILFYVTATAMHHVDEREAKQWFHPQEISKEETIHSDYILATHTDLPSFMTFETQD